MWWRSLPVLALIAALSLSGCGFHPLYNHRVSASADVKKELGAVRVATISDRTGQILHNKLLERLTPEGEPEKPRYTLNVTMTEVMYGINFQKDATASGGEMNITVVWYLNENDTGRMVRSGSFSSVDSVNYLGPRYASVSAERDAEQRLLSDIADVLTDQISVYLQANQRRARTQ
jgi:LPS-assembly lipoprotein